MKKLIGIVLACMMLLSLAACRGKEPAHSSDPTAAPKKTAEPASTQDAQATENGGDTPRPFATQTPDRQAFDPDTDADNRYTCANIKLIETEGGFYWLTPWGGYFYFLYYDESLQEVIPVCSKPECEHFKDGNLNNKNANCDAFADVVGHPSIYKGKMYYVDRYGDPNPNTNEQTLGNKLYRMDPDGTNREFIKDVFSPGFGGGIDVIHRGFIYSFVHESRIVNGEAESRAMLLALPIEGDETSFRVLYELDKSCWGGLRFVGDRCYFWIHYADGEYLEDEDGMPIVDHLIPGGVIGYWDSAEEKLEILFDGQFAQGDVSNLEGMWVTPDEAIYVTLSTGLARFENGEFTLTASFEDPEHEYCPPVISDGIVILREKTNGRYRPEEDPIWWIMDFNGNTVYKAPLPMGWIDEKGLDRNEGSLMYLGGDANALYVDFTFWQDDEEWDYLVRYDLVDGELIQTIFGPLYCAPTEEMW